MEMVFQYKHGEREWGRSRTGTRAYCFAAELASDLDMAEHVTVLERDEDARVLRSARVSGSSYNVRNHLLEALRTIESGRAQEMWLEPRDG